MTPAQRHAGQDKALLAARHAVYQQAKERNPARWSRDARDWSPVEAVALNPERDAVIGAYCRGEDKPACWHESGDNDVDLFHSGSGR